MIGVNGRGDGDYFVTGACRETAAPGTQRSPAEYYVQGHEPAGVWLTRGSNPLGVEGEVDPDKFTTLVNKLEDPETGAPLGKRP